ncbi:MAG TPA: hypothetical protein VGY76_10700 [Solirubrobacteraceae bacterium]|jgi:hypothetical protein|nr:hypothetical protein [Solirubrobacteraceae bacterium]
MAATSTKAAAIQALEDLAAHPDVRALLSDSFLDAYELMMGFMGWGEDHIDAMCRSHPEHADRIWHSFKLLRPTADLMRTEAVYRAHCTEILERVIAREDTRPGTAAECCIACCEASLLAPLTPAGTGVYLRLWAKAGLPGMDDIAREPYEALRGKAIDEHERVLRRKLKQDWRTLPKVIEHLPGCPETKAATAGQPGCVDA